jgi:hypothetical protein
MQDLPNYATEPMGNGPDGGLIGETGHQTAEHHLKITAFLRDRSVARLGSELDAGIYFLSRSDCYGLLRAFFLARTGSHPSRQLRRRRECTSLRPHLGDDLLR